MAEGLSGGSVRAWALVWFLIAAAMGCGGRLVATSSKLASDGEGSTAKLVFEAGVVAANRTGYLCLPFERVGLDAGTTVETLSSSCECVQPRLVHYKTVAGGNGRAIMLEFVNEGATGDSRSLPANSEASLGTDAANAVDLGVIVTVELADGGTRKFTVNLLHTTLADLAEGERP